MRDKAIPGAVHGAVLEKLLLAKYKGVIYDLKNKKYVYLAFYKFFVRRSLRLRRLRSLRLRRTILSSPIMAKSKKVCYKTLIFRHN